MFVNITTKTSGGTRNWLLKYSCAFALETAVRTAVRVMRDAGDERPEGLLIDTAVEAACYAGTLRLLQVDNKKVYYTFDWTNLATPLIIPGDDVELAG